MQGLQHPYKEGGSPKQPRSRALSTLWLRKLPDRTTVTILKDAFQQWGGRVLRVLYDPITLTENGQAIVQLPGPDIVSSLSLSTHYIVAEPSLEDSMVCKEDKEAKWKQDACQSVTHLVGESRVTCDLALLHGCKPC